jgi:asparagine synthase (glutamine-hydrolysing)
MCGICGFVGAGQQNVIDSMLGAMAYRGPDGDGYWTDEHRVHLGHKRLAIVDLADGDQPLLSGDSALAIVFNGEIYNHKELRRSLEARGHRFLTDHSDTEVLLHGYREWGTSLTDRLNGMWAFAIFDKNNGKIWLSRDRFGKKPLFFSHVGETFVFSSELTSIIRHPAISSTIDSLSLKKYFAYGYVPAPRSLVKGVNKLCAGHNLIFDLPKNSLRVWRYWRYTPEPDDRHNSNRSETTENLISELFKSVDLRLQADVPVGVFLSGGVDSSAVLALAQAARRGLPVSTFSIGFEESSFDESRYANEVAQILGSDHYSEILSANKCVSLLDVIYNNLDEPIADSSLVPSSLMCKLAAGNITVGLGGDGSDELFAGYDPFRALSAAQTYTNVVPKLFHRGVTKLVGQTPVSHRNMSLDFKMKKFLSGLGFDENIRNPIWLGTLPPAHLSRLFGEPIDLTEIYSEAIDAWSIGDGYDAATRTIQFYIELYLQNDILVKMDRAGMMNSLEVRSPFLDINFVNLVRTIPTTMKFDGKTTKKILKESLYPVLPLDILHRPKKGFGVPIGNWFRSGQLEVNTDKFSSLFDNKVVRNLANEHSSNRADWRTFLWAHFALEKWADQLN